MVAAVLCALGINVASSGQVIVNMPAPKRPTNLPVVVATKQTDVGSLALHRYARVRTGTYDNYFAGYRRWNYWHFNDPWFFDFPCFGNFGTRFVGKINHSFGHHHHSHSVPCMKH